ncbi:MAG: hypothetical protein OD816_001195 [Thermodesulfobacterium sp.]|uniref:TIGR04219 family outer membrane beta-barrel protein n=1 Tax=Candidatus Thermodesulfobacterium syntrophicum TaxID=3060442 RepID=A0AAE3P4L7_9BACT|nr:hypothetical protein [Candidatus Thermodesulfobacterium syntrophicum]
MKVLKNKKKVLSCGLIGIMFFSFVSTSNAQEISGGFSIDVMSKYIWRGIKVHNKVAVQNNLYLSYKNFTVDFWSDYKTGDKSKVDEVDITLDYTKKFTLKNEEFFLSAGYIYYDINEEDTQEVYIKGGYKILNLPLFLKVSIYRDIDAIQSTYLEIKGSGEVNLNPLIFFPYMTFGYYWYDEGENDWNNLEFGLDGSYLLDEHLNAHFQATYSIGNDDMGLEDEFWGGIGIEFSF